MAVDGSGNSYLTGGTGSANFPVVNPFDGTINHSQDVFVSKFAADGGSLVYSTYIGGSSGYSQGGSAIAIDGSGNAYVTGWTGATNFPTTTGAFQTSLGGFAYTDAFLEISDQFREIATVFLDSESDAKEMLAAHSPAQHPITPKA